MRETSVYTVLLFICPCFSNDCSSQAAGNSARRTFPETELTAYPPGSLLRFECNSPAQPVSGHSLLACQNDGSWNASVLVCEVNSSVGSSATTSLIASIIGGLLCGGLLLLVTIFCVRNCLKVNAALDEEIRQAVEREKRRQDVLDEQEELSVAALTKRRPMTAMPRISTDKKRDEPPRPNFKVLRAKSAFVQSRVRRLSSGQSCEDLKQTSGMSSLPVPVTGSQQSLCPVDTVSSTLPQVRDVWGSVPTRPSSGTISISVTMEQTSGSRTSIETEDNVIEEGRSSLNDGGKSEDHHDMELADKQHLFPDLPDIVISSD